MHTPNLISISEAAVMLGYGSGSTLRRLAIAGRIPGAVKIGSQWALPIEWVEAKEREGPQPATGGLRGAGVRKKTK